METPPIVTSRFSFLSTLLGRVWRFVRTHKMWVTIGVIVALPVAGFLYFVFSPTQPSYVTAEAVRGDLRQTVEAVGTVISDRDLELQFATAGIVAEVKVKEGDVVKQGQVLAGLRAGNLAAAIASASAQVQVAEAALREKLEGSRPEDIAISEADVFSKHAALDGAKAALATAKDALKNSEEKLDALQSEVTTGLAGYVTNVGSTVSKEATSALNELSSVEDIFANNDVTDAVIKDSTSNYDIIRLEIVRAEQVLSGYTHASSPQDFKAALLLLQQARASVATAWDVTNRSFDLISILPQTTYFTETSRQTYKSTLTTSRSTLQTSLNTIDTAIKTLRDASATYETRMTTEEANVAAAEGAITRATSDIATYEAALRIAEAQLQLKKAPVRETDLDAAEGNVRQARAALQRAQADYSNTLILAPIDGTITKVNVKVGEASPVGAAVSMLGDSPFRIEMYVSEIDIPKVVLSQTGSVELDAFRDKPFALRVTEIDAAPTDREGVSKYRVRLDFTEKQNLLKIGMTGDAVIVTAVAKDVVSVPVRAVLQRETGGSYVRIKEKGDTIIERDVETGLEGEGGMIEVTGVEEGETVIVLEKI